MTARPRPGQYPAELRERAVRLVWEGETAYRSELEAICAVAELLGTTAETVRKWVRRAEVDDGSRPGVTTDERARLKLNRPGLDGGSGYWILTPTGSACGAA
jgi:transposase